MGSKLLNLLFCILHQNFFYRNLLRPTGVGLQEAVFTLKVYRAEDLPQSKLIFFQIAIIGD